MSEQRNLILAIALSLAILMVFQVLGKKPKPPVETQTVEQQQAAPTPAPGVPAPPQTAPLSAPGSAPPSVGQADAGTDPGTRIRIETPSLHGSISLVGARVDALTLVKYREAIDPKSPEITLLSPLGSPAPYFAEFGWVASAGQTIDMPGPATRWTADRAELTPAHPVTLSWTNKAGIRFSRTFAVDDKYMFTVTQQVENNGPAPVTLRPYGLITRVGTPKTMGMYIMHEGPLGVLDGTLKEKNYSDLSEPEGAFKGESTGGWAGFTDKYWLVALAPDPKTKTSVRFFHQPFNSTDLYQVDHLDEAMTAAPGTAIVHSEYLFTGAKEAETLDHYSEKLGIDRFDLAIDFGWYYFLTKPFFYALRFLHGLVGNFGVAILLFTVVIKGLFYPLANKSYVAMSMMKKLQPEVKKLQGRFADDKVRLNQELMALYKREKVNPASGCLPILVQIPVFFSLYKVLFISIEMRHAPFFGWIHDLSAPDPTSLFNLFGLIPWTPPDMLMIGVWPLIMGATMYLQQKLNPQPADPIQAKMFMFLPLVFTVMLSQFAAGLVIYWAWNNVLSIAQQWTIMKRMGVPS
ncbi:MAG: membrane protein insertase YidC [Alphaproteobacteria bacterium]|nr:membrane protein insertase YidC [Alphaproteobacteria bacterium]